MEVKRFMKGGKYKILSIEPTDTLNGCFITMREGKKGEGYNTISIKANKEDLAYISMATKEFFKQIKDEE